LEDSKLSELEIKKLTADIWNVQLKNLILMGSIFGTAIGLGFGILGYFIGKGF